MQSSVDYINVEYLLVRLYEFLLGVQNFSFTLPSFGPSLVTGIYIFGMCASLILLILIVYTEIMLHHVEHEGFHALEAKAHAHHAVEVESTRSNDRWERIVQLANSTNHGDWRRAILEADIMLSDTLMAEGYQGFGVGEQLKMANPIQLTTLDLAWKAHKVRNEIAHGGESYQLGERDTKTAIDYYKRVFEELGAI